MTGVTSRPLTGYRRVMLATGILAIVVSPAALAGCPGRDHVRSQ
jgi:hypothetical protein